LSDDKKVGPPVLQILETEVDGDISLYNPGNESVTILNGTASDVWMLCDGEHSAEEIISLLASSYGVDVEQIRDEVTRAIDEFVEAGLLSA
jgi:hypothetical protein